MDEITQKELRSVLNLNYWSVAQGLHYLAITEGSDVEKYYYHTGEVTKDITNGDWNKIAKQTEKYNATTFDKYVLRLHKLKVLWRDTDHDTPPRNTSHHPTDDHTEYLVRRFLVWALDRNLEVFWLDWARKEQLIPADLPYKDKSSENYHATLRRLLNRNYWKVDQGIDYLARGNTNLASFKRPESNNSQETLSYYKLRIEYEELWYDTDHSVEARAGSDTPTSGFGQFPVHYIISWALSKRIAVPWLNWAQEKMLLPDSTELGLEENIPYSVDWTKWGKTRKIQLSEACGLLAEIDLAAYNCAQAKNMHWFSSEHITDLIRDQIIVEERKDWRSMRVRFNTLEQIRHVVMSNIANDSFIEIDLIEVSREQVEKDAPYSPIPEGEGFFINKYVDLPTFGKWAASAGYELPPEFPITSELNNAKTDGASKGGKARAAFYSGAKEACRDFAKSLRAGKDGGEQPSLDYCTELIDKERECIEAEHNVNLPKPGTIREYLKTKPGEDPI